MNSTEIVDDPDDAEDADSVVCVKVTYPLILPDNLVAPCSMCGELVQFRPHAPKTPPRVCIDCITPLMEKDAAQGKLTVVITPKTAEEVRQYLERKKAH